MSDKELEQTLKDIQEAAKENKNIDVASLMIQQLEQHHENTLSRKQRYWAYLVSVGLPPLGLIFAVVFYFSGKSDGKRVALTCVILTVLSIALFYFTIKIMFSSAGVSVDQLQQAPGQLQNLLQ